MKNLLVIFFSLFCFSFSLMAKRISFSHYEGKINDKYAVEVQLSWDTTNNLNGSYHYIGKIEFIYLKGNISSDSVVKLTENGASWNGKMKSDGSIAGTWKSDDGKKTFPFLLAKKSDATGVCLEYFAGESIANYYFSNNKMWSVKEPVNLEDTGDKPNDTISLGSETIGWDYYYVNGGNKNVRNKIDSVLLPAYFLRYKNRASDALITNAQANLATKDYMDTVSGEDLGVEYDSLNNPFTWNSNGANDNRWSNVVWDAMGVLCVSVEDESYTGGAHPNTYVGYYNFDCKTGNVIKLNDIFLPGYQKVLLKKLQAFKLENTDNGAGDCIYADTIPLTENFYLTDQGITFFYNQYEIAPYVCGTFEFQIDWADIQNLINPKGSMAWVRE
jgi:hypothetical protein